MAAKIVVSAAHRDGREKEMKSAAALKSKCHLRQWVLRLVDAVRGIEARSAQTGKMACRERLADIISRRIRGRAAK